MPYDLKEEPITNGIVRHPTIPHAAPPETLPEINMYRLTGADLRTFLEMQGEGVNAQERKQIGFDLLEKAVDGGMAAIPLPYIGEYVKQLNDLLSEAMNPRGADEKNSGGGSGGTSGPKARSRRNS